jgi:hypothetical protein
MIDFYARESHHREHALAIYEKMPISHRGVITNDILGCLNEYVAVFSFGDLKVASRAGKKIIFCEHGAGQYYNTVHGSYAGSLEYRENVVLRLSPNEIHAKKEREVLKCPVVVVGMPKLDKYHKLRLMRLRTKRHPTIAISFHWDCRVCPETRSAYRTYLRALPRLGRDYETLGHAHPRLWQSIRGFYPANSIKPVQDFDEIVRRADIYICDNSSTIFEFAYTGKPVILLNCPHYRKDVEHEGNVRFWKHANMGYQANNAIDLFDAIQKTIESPLLEAQEEAVKAVCTFTDGKCGERAVQAILSVLNSKNLDANNTSGVSYNKENNTRGS